MFRVDSIRFHSLILVRVRDLARSLQSGLWTLERPLRFSGAGGHGRLCVYLSQPYIQSSMLTLQNTKSTLVPQPLRGRRIFIITRRNEALQVSQCDNSNTDLAVLIADVFTISDSIVESETNA
ncbi:hypothetical protein B0H12DRAFT_728368 [Mycena haematopus]|nr:hypothetical protein B0H12DRAFT_728368 [Mycena haematopus]